MPQNSSTLSNYAHTVTGAVPVENLGSVLISESLLSVYPGAEFAPNIIIDKSDVFEVLKNKLIDFRNAGGKTIIDRTGMFHGRDIRFLENLSKATDVYIIASTGLGPQKLLSGYFLTPQKNPPTPWSAEQFAALFIKEVEEGIVVPRLFRGASAGIVTSIADTDGIKELEINLFQAAALTSIKTGIPMSVQYGKDALAELELILQTGIPANRVIIGNFDRIQKTPLEDALEIAKNGAYVAIDHIGWTPQEGFIDEQQRIKIIKELINAGYLSQILLSTNAVGVAKGHTANAIPFDYLLTTFVPQLEAAGVSQAQIKTMLETNPQTVLAVQNTVSNSIKEDEKQWVK